VVSRGEVEVVAGDGTVLSARVTGSGPPMVLVHGTSADKETWGLVEPTFAKRYTVWSYDRRGRGRSGNGTDYDFGVEVDDVRAVVAAAGTDTHLVGHSFGACCALEAAALGCPLASLVLYEAPFHEGRRAEQIQRALDCLDAGDHEAALLVFLPEVVGVSEDEVTMLRGLPEVWARIVAAAPTIGREMTALAKLGWDPTRYGAIDVPTLYITGGLTSSPVYLSRDELLAGVPHASHTVLSEQRHLANGTAPTAFAEAVIKFTTKSH